MHKIEKIRYNRKGGNKILLSDFPGMNPISAFFVRNIVIVYFFYGLAFFSLGLALALAGRRSSQFRFAQAIKPLAAFGLLHGAHEWIEMFQKYAAMTSEYVPSLWEETIRTLILLVSLLLLLLFGVLLLSPTRLSPRQMLRPLAAMTALWLASMVVVWLAWKPQGQELIAVADVLSRYSLGIPGALLGTWALMRQQRTFREHGMPQFGRYLVWAASALFLYGVIGQVFVRQTVLAPSTFLNSTMFLHWFGIPVQLFRGIMAAALAFYITRALNVFELESQRRIEAANEEKVRAQQAQIEAERRNREEMERLNKDLRFTTHELALLLELANLLVAPASVKERLQAALDKLESDVHLCKNSLVLLKEHTAGALDVLAFSGFAAGATSKLFRQAVEIGTKVIEMGQVICLRIDGATLNFHPTDEEGRLRCQQYPSPMIVLGLPLIVQDEVIGSLTFAWETARGPIEDDEFRLVFAAAQQLGLSTEHARLTEEAKSRERLLGRLLQQSVGAQEAERTRIARELHDATGQSLTAIALGLRGVESILEREQSKTVEQIRALGGFSTNALGELRQIIADLRPTHLDDLGLAATLKWYLKAYQERSGIETHLELIGESKRLHPEYATALFRIVQEALTNVAKHAGASRIDVTLRTEKTQVSLGVADDGKGFDVRSFQEEGPALSAWGLLGIQERVSLLGGSVHFDSAPGQGACINVVVPFVAEDVR